MKKLIIPKQIVTLNKSFEVFRDHAVEVIDGIITRIVNLKDINIVKYDGEIRHFNNYTLMPGFVQTHVHLCQSLFRGLADDMELLDWLQKRIFPYENSHDKNSLKTSAQLGIHELLTSGTTTILDMGTINHQEVVFEEMINSGIRGFSGKCMIDENELYPKFKESTESCLKSTQELAKEFHNSEEGRIKYGFAPRFVLSCSEGLLKETLNLMDDFEGSLYHTHSSENKDEIAAVKRKYGKENIEFFDSIGVLSDHTVLAHCIHVNDNEVSILKNTGTRVAHCPSANLKLGSGIADIPKYLKEGISVSLGADGAPCNNNLNIFVEMRLAALIQKPRYNAKVMDAKSIVKMATIDGAKALHLDNEIGSIEVGKKADIILLDLERANQSLGQEDENIYSSIVYSAHEENIKEVMVNGKWLVTDGISQYYNEHELIENGKKDLTDLFERT